MIEEIKKEIHKQEEYYMCTKCNDISKEDINKIYIKKDKVFEILDKYNNQPKEILHVGSRIGKSLQQSQNIAKYINDNKLTECNINVVEVPNDYKNAWEELKQEKLVKNYLLEYMQELEQKYKIGDKNE